MNEILTGISKWLAWKGVTLILILAVLLGGAWLKGELKRTEELGRDRNTLVTRVDTLLKQIAELKRDAAERAKKATSEIKGLNSTLLQQRADRDKLWNEHYWRRKNPLSDVSLQIRILDSEIAVSEFALERVMRAKALLEGDLNTRIKQRENDVDLLNEQILDIAGEIDKAYVVRIASKISEEFPLALSVLAGIILVPSGIRIFFYFVVAPLAAGRPPIRLLPPTSGSIHFSSAEGIGGSRGEKMSAVSLPVVLEENQELLIQPEYLQSTSLHASKKTKWLLNNAIPFASLLSGMFMLTRVSPAGSEPIVISATKDPLSEVGIVDLADGAAFVCQPRSLAGVIQDRRRPMHVTRHWRLGSLQSWLTLQLRFLVFHGPGRLVMKGCRGIRIESAGTGRLINQAATLGFSADLDYANTRCETFVSYWMGKEDLFNDLFTGENGVYVYEEMPDLKRRSGVTGRGLAVC